MEPLDFIILLIMCEYILTIIKNEGRDLIKCDNPLLVDFGSSYGHLLEIAKKEGFRAIGVEINDHLLEYLRKKGFRHTRI